jgi:hypothetical protein
VYWVGEQDIFRPRDVAEKRKEPLRSRSVRLGIRQAVRNHDITKLKETLTYLGTSRPGIDEVMFKHNVRSLPSCRPTSHNTAVGEAIWVVRRAERRGRGREVGGGCVGKNAQSVACGGKAKWEAANRPSSW